MGVEDRDWWKDAQDKRDGTGSSQRFSRAIGRASDGAPVHYGRHRPEQTTPYRLVPQHATSFIAHTEASISSKLTARNLPFVGVGLRCIGAGQTIRPRCCFQDNTKSTATLDNDTLSGKGLSQIPA